MASLGQMFLPWLQSLSALPLLKEEEGFAEHVSLELSFTEFFPAVRFPLNLQMLCIVGREESDLLLWTYWLRLPILDCTIWLPATRIQQWQNVME